MIGRMADTLRECCLWCAHSYIHSLCGQIIPSHTCMHEHIYFLGVYIHTQTTDMHTDHEWEIDIDGKKKKKIERPQRNKKELIIIRMPMPDVSRTQFVLYYSLYIHHYFHSVNQIAWPVSSFFSNAAKKEVLFSYFHQLLLRLNESGERFTAPHNCHFKARVCVMSASTCVGGSFCRVLWLLQTANTLCKTLSACSRPLAPT